MLFSKLLMMIYSDEIIKRDLDGNLLIHILIVVQEKSNKITFWYREYFMNKNNLMRIKFITDNTKYYCEDYLKNSPKMLIHDTVRNSNFYSDF